MITRSICIKSIPPLISRYRPTTIYNPIQYNRISAYTMSTVSSVRVHKTGDASVLQYDSNLPQLQYNTNQVLIEIAYSGINFIDTYQRSGLYPLSLPFTLGREASGIVREVGSNVKSIRSGDRVAFMSQGTYSTYCVADEKDIISIPNEITLKDAAAVALQGLTAHYLVCSNQILNNTILSNTHTGR